VSAEHADAAKKAAHAALELLQKASERVTHTHTTTTTTSHRTTGIRTLVHSAKLDQHTNPFMQPTHRVKAKNIF
jgi:hypothetical protein